MIQIAKNTYIIKFKTFKSIEKRIKIKRDRPLVLSSKSVFIIIIIIIFVLQVAKVQFE